MTLMQVQDAIVAELGELSQDIYDDGVPDDTRLRFDSAGNLLPYIIVEHAGVTVNQAGMPVTGVKDAAGNSVMSVLCIAPSQRASRQVAELVRQKLIGFKPLDAGELTPITSPYTYIDATARPTRYVSEIMFSFILNTVW
jgi:hypothetical protein